MINYKIRDLEDNLISIFNTSDVPIEAKRLVAQNVLNLITKEADKTILEEIKEKKQQEEKKEEE